MEYNQFKTLWTIWQELAKYVDIVQTIVLFPHLYITVGDLPEGFTEACHHLVYILLRRDVVVCHQHFIQLVGRCLTDLD